MEAIKCLMSIIDKLCSVAGKINEQETSINRNVYKKTMLNKISNG